MTRPRLELTDAQKEMMQSACAREAPREACGIVAGGVCYEVRNHSSSDATFHISAEDIAEIANRHRGYEGIWHTHPSGDPLPSRSDWAYHPSSKALVVATRTEVNVYYADDTEDA